MKANTMQPTPDHSQIQQYANSASALQYELNNRDINSQRANQILDGLNGLRSDVVLLSRYARKNSETEMMNQAAESLVSIEQAYGALLKHEDQLTDANLAGIRQEISRNGSDLTGLNYDRMTQMDGTSYNRQHLGLLDKIDSSIKSKKTNRMDSLNQYQSSVLDKNQRLYLSKDELQNIDQEIIRLREEIKENGNYNASVGKTVNSARAKIRYELAQRKQNSNLSLTQLLTEDTTIGFKIRKLSSHMANVRDSGKYKLSDSVLKYMINQMSSNESLTKEHEESLFVLKNYVETEYKQGLDASDLAEVTKEANKAKEHIAKETYVSAKEPLVVKDNHVRDDQVDNTVKDTNLETVVKPTSKLRPITYRSNTFHNQVVNREYRERILRRIQGSNLYRTRALKEIAAEDIAHKEYFDTSLIPTGLSVPRTGRNRFGKVAVAALVALVIAGYGSLSDGQSAELDSQTDIESTEYVTPNENLIENKKSDNTNSINTNDNANSPTNNEATDSLNNLSLLDFGTIIDKVPTNEECSKLNGTVYTVKPGDSYIKITKNQYGADNWKLFSVPAFLNLKIPESYNGGLFRTIHSGEDICLPSLEDALTINGLNDLNPISRMRLGYQKPSQAVMQDKITKAVTIKVRENKAQKKADKKAIKVRERTQKSADNQYQNNEVSLEGSTFGFGLDTTLSLESGFNQRQQNIPNHELQLEFQRDIYRIVKDSFDDKLNVDIVYVPTINVPESRVEQYESQPKPKKPKKDVEMIDTPVTVIHVDGDGNQTVIKKIEKRPKDMTPAEFRKKHKNKLERYLQRSGRHR